MSNNDNLWFELGELPPVGTIVEFCNKTKSNERICIDDWLEGDRLEVIAIRSVHHCELPIVFNTRDHTASAIITKNIRPIKSDREKAIDELVILMNDNTNMCFTEIAEKLYDAGYKKERRND